MLTHEEIEETVTELKTAKEQLMAQLNFVEGQLRAYQLVLSGKPKPVEASTLPQGQGSADPVEANGQTPAKKSKEAVPADQIR